MHIIGSEENALFYGYQQEMLTLYDQSKALTSQENGKTDSVTVSMLRTKKQELLLKTTTFRKQFYLDHAHTFTVKLLKEASEPEIPRDQPTLTNHSDPNFPMHYLKRHYWDEFDFSDGRLLRTPFLQGKLERYIKELTNQVPDSLIKAADFVVDKAIAGQNKDIKNYTIYYITSQYERPTIVGVEGLYVHMFEKYYATGIMSVSDTATIKIIGQLVAAMRRNLTGKSFSMPAVSDTLGQALALKALKAEYSVIYFYSPTCGHCRESAPKVAQFADKYKSQGIRVVAIAVDQSPQEWKAFIKQFKLGNAINGYDFTHTIDFRHQYDVFMTPTVYILNKDKTILAPKLPVENIEDFILFQKRKQVTSSTASKKG
ncbi:DUF5106 domain-containing protein [Spirosoma flavus]